MSAVDSLIQSTVRIECFSEGKASVGSSFLYRLNNLDDPEGLDENSWVPLLITNRHVLEGFDNARMYFALEANFQDQSGDRKHEVVINELQKFCIYHPNPQVDLAAVVLAPIAKEVFKRGKKIQLVSVRHQDIPSNEDFANIRIVEDILVVGYPQGFWDNTRNLPLFRSGITSTPPMLDYQGEPKFLIDCSIFPGSSGSPVFLYNSPVVFDKSNQNIRFGERVKLLGIVSAVMIYQADGSISEQPIPSKVDGTTITNIPNNLGVVIRSSQIEELVQIARKL